jgi:hypothetical protein
MGEKARLSARAILPFKRSNGAQQRFYLLGTLGSERIMWGETLTAPPQPEETGLKEKVTMSFQSVYQV